MHPKSLASAIVISVVVGWILAALPDLPTAGRWTAGFVQRFAAHAASAQTPLLIVAGCLGAMSFGLTVVRSVIDARSGTPPVLELPGLLSSLWLLTFAASLSWAGTLLLARGRAVGLLLLAGALLTSWKLVRDTRRWVQFHAGLY
jgi:hypothetical protein